MSTHVGRNDPCPCGSGLKYKNCHAGKVNLGLRGQPAWVWVALGLIVVAGVAWAVMRSQNGSSAPTRMVMTPQPTTPSASTLPATGAAPGAVSPGPAATTTGRAPVGGLPGAAAPQPWQYDAGRNQHYDPNHGHWHDGPPPPPEQRVATAAPGTAPGTAPGGPTPAPWTYDQKNNQHWDPNHGHWHPGPPPAEGAR